MWDFSEGDTAWTPGSIENGLPRDVRASDRKTIIMIVLESRCILEPCDVDFSR